MPPKPIRLSDNDKHFGSIDISERGTWRPFGLSLRLSSNEEDGHMAAIYLRAFGWTIRLRLPDFLGLNRRRQLPDGVKEYEMRGWEYGFMFTDRTLMVDYGLQTWSSGTTRSKCWFLPWLDKRHVRRSMYDAFQNHFWTEWSERSGRGPYRDSWAAQDAVLAACPKVRFLMKDFDGEVITVTTYVEEREWRHGRGWFKWLSWFVKPTIQRCLVLEFSSEVGPQKGSWKGGLMGTGYEMVPGESHEDTFRRFCASEHTSKYRKFRVEFIKKLEEPREDRPQESYAAANETQNAKV